MTFLSILLDTFEKLIHDINSSSFLLCPQFPKRSSGDRFERDWNVETETGALNHEKKRPTFQPPLLFPPFPFFFFFSFFQPRKFQLSFVWFRGTSFLRVKKCNFPKNFLFTQSFLVSHSRAILQKRRTIATQRKNRGSKGYRRYTWCCNTMEFHCWMFHFRTTIDR